MSYEQPNKELTQDKVLLWVEMTTGTFQLTDIYREMNILSEGGKSHLRMIMKRLKDTGIVATTGGKDGGYRFINKEIEVVDWWKVDARNTLEINWPRSHGNDDTRFGFDGAVDIYPNDIIVVAGMSNMGKSTFCHNFIVENMDNHKVVLMTTEYHPEKFKARMDRMSWANIYNGNGEPKFKMIKRDEHWEDIVHPGYINVIDWIEIDDKFWDIAKIIKGIEKGLDGGVAVITIQKSEGKDLGRGGTFSLERAALYVAIDFGRLTVVKAKSWHEPNPNHKMYGFEIVNGGTTFENIREVKKCQKCKGFGNNWGKKCEDCKGKGYIDGDIEF